MKSKDKPKKGVEPFSSLHESDEITKYSTSAGSRSTIGGEPQLRWDLVTEIILGQVLLCSHLIDKIPKRSLAQ